MQRCATHNNTGLIQEIATVSSTVSVWHVRDYDSRKKTYWNHPIPSKMKEKTCILSAINKTLSNIYSSWVKRLTNHSCVIYTSGYTANLAWEVCKRVKICRTICIEKMNFWYNMFYYLVHLSIFVEKWFAQQKQCKMRYLCMEVDGILAYQL